MFLRHYSLRVVFMASIFGVNLGMFYKRRDYATIVDGVNPIVAHDFCGESVKNKDVIVIDDMIASGGSIIDTSTQLKSMGAKRVKEMIELYKADSKSGN